MTKEQLAHWLKQISSEMQGASEQMIKLYSDDCVNAKQLQRASLMMKSWVEKKYKKDVDL